MCHQFLRLRIKLPRINPGTTIPVLSQPTSIECEMWTGALQPPPELGAGTGVSILRSDTGIGVVSTANETGVWLSPPVASGASGVGFRLGWRVGG